MITLSVITLSGFHCTYKNIKRQKTVDFDINPLNDWIVWSEEQRPFQWKFLLMVETWDA